MPQDTTTFRLRNAITFRKLDEIRELLGEAALVNRLNEDEKYPVIQAAGQAMPDVVRILLDAGADVNVTEPGSGTPLMKAGVVGVI